MASFNRPLTVSHGDYLHTQPIWRNRRVTTLVHRPAKEDVIRYTPQIGILSLQLAGRDDSQRRHFIDAWQRSRISCTNCVGCRWEMDWFRVGSEPRAARLQSKRSCPFDWCRGIGVASE